MNYNEIDKLMFWWYDESVRQFLLWYYWPNFVMGNADDWMKMGITLNGMRPVNLCKTN